MFKMFNRDREAGFSLVELLVVVVIIGILAAIAIPLFSNQRNRAYKATAQEDGRTIAMEITAMLSDITTMPTAPATNGTFVGLSGETLTLTFNGTPTPDITKTSTIRVTSGTTVTASGYAAGAVTTTPTWCIIVSNNSQNVVYTQDGLQGSKSTCAAAGTVA